jgi:hypothetical protein
VCHRGRRYRRGLGRMRELVDLDVGSDVGSDGGR